MGRILWRGLAGAVRKRRPDEELRKELIPDLDVDALRKLTPSAPSTQPVPVAVRDPRPRLTPPSTSRHP